MRASTRRKNNKQCKSPLGTALEFTSGGRRYLEDTVERNQLRCVTKSQDPHGFSVFFSPFSGQNVVCKWAQNFDDGALKEYRGNFWAMRGGIERDGLNGF